MQVTIVKARRRVEDSWKEETNALQQLQRLESEVAQQEDTVPVRARAPPLPDCSLMQTFTLQTDLDRRRFEAMKRHFFEIDWSWAEVSAQCSALVNFGTQNRFSDTLKKWRWQVLWL